MIPLLLALALLLAPTGPAVSGVSPRDLAGIEFAPPPGARIPRDLALPDLAGHFVNLSQALAGRPGLLIPIDYTCRTTCGPALTIAVGALAQSGLRAGVDYTLAVVGIDAKDGAAQARAMTEGRLDDASLAAGSLVLVGDRAGTPALLSALGYKAAYDRDTDQFVHPAGAVALTRDGRVGRVLSTLALTPHDLRLALVEAGEGRIGDLGDRFTLLCSGFDPVHGVYTSLIRRILAAAGLLTLALLAGALLLLLRRERTRAEAG